MTLGNHQATDAKKDEITTVVLKSANPYLPLELSSSTKPVC
jgi:hypothetical protein